MKKTVAVLALIVSAGAFAQGRMGNQMNRGTVAMHNSRGGMMMQQIDNLTPEQQAKFNDLHSKQMKENQKLMLDIQEVNLKIQREMASDNPNQKNIDRLIDQRTKLQAQHQKDMLRFRLEMKEKFGIEMMGGMMKGNMMRGSGMKGHMMSF